MSKKLTFILLLHLILISCKKSEQKNTPKIEIYLIENRITSHQGIEINESNIDSLKLRELSNRFDFNIVRFDTLKSELIFAGEFKADKTDLKEKAFISNNEILSFDHNNGNLKIDSIAIQKLNEIKPNGYGIQFALLVDDSPELFGYFYPTIYSTLCSTFHYNPSVKSNDELELYYGKNWENADLKSQRKSLYKKLNKN